MNPPSKATDPASLHIGRLHLVTDRPLGDATAQALGRRLADALDAALVRAGIHGSLGIGELSVDLGADALDDERFLTRVADSLARRILDRVPD